jgi:hypothetical protein
MQPKTTLGILQARISCLFPLERPQNLLLAPSYVPRRCRFRIDIPGTPQDSLLKVVEENKRLDCFWIDVDVEEGMTKKDSHHFEIIDGFEALRTMGSHRGYEAPDLICVDVVEINLKEIDNWVYAKMESFSVCESVVNGLQPSLGKKM